MQIGLSYDHNGYEISKTIKDYLKNKGYKVIDYNNKYNKDDDYPIEALQMLENKQDYEKGILICGSGIGMSIIANKVKGIRCAKIDNIQEAQSAKEHNNANILAFSATSHTAPQIKEMIEKFINSTFNLEPRYKIRIEQVEKYEESNEY